MAAKTPSKNPNIATPTLINSWPSFGAYITALVRSIVNELRDHAIYMVEKAADLTALEVRVTDAEADIVTNTNDIDALEAANYVNTIEGAEGNLTLNETSGIEISGSAIQLRQGSSSQFGAVKVDNTTITASAGVISAVAPDTSLDYETAELSGANVALNNTANYFDGPSVSLDAGTWFVIATVTVGDASATNSFSGKLWDGTNVIGSAAAYTSSTLHRISMTISGVIVLGSTTTVKVSVRAPTASTGVMYFNHTGNSQDSHIRAVRIA
jgi:hypothetical protein